MRCTDLIRTARLSRAILAQVTHFWTLNMSQLSCSAWLQQGRLFEDHTAEPRTLMMDCDIPWK
jgi:hypothetical protein